MRCRLGRPGSPGAYHHAKPTFRIKSTATVIMLPNHALKYFTWANSFSRIMRPKAYEVPHATRQNIKVASHDLELFKSNKYPTPSNPSEPNKVTNAMISNNRGRSLSFFVNFNRSTNLASFLAFDMGLRHRRATRAGGTGYGYVKPPAVFERCSSNKRTRTRSLMVVFHRHVSVPFQLPLIRVTTNDFIKMENEMVVAEGLGPSISCFNLTGSFPPILHQSG